VLQRPLGSLGIYLHYERCPVLRVPCPISGIDLVTQLVMFSVKSVSLFWRFVMYSAKSSTVQYCCFGGKPPILWSFYPEAASFGAVGFFGKNALSCTVGALSLFNGQCHCGHSEHVYMQFTPPPRPPHLRVFIPGCAAAICRLARCMPCCIRPPVSPSLPSHTSGCLHRCPRRRRLLTLPCCVLPVLCMLVATPTGARTD
jgi:hypothetical protein